MHNLGLIILQLIEMINLRKYFLICLVVATLVAPIINPHMFANQGIFWMTLSFSLIYTFSGLYGSIWLFKFLDKKFDWTKDIWKRLIIGVLAVESWSVFIYVLITPPLLFLFYDSSWSMILDEMKANVKYPLLMGLPGMLIMAAIEFFQNWKNSYLKQQKLKAEMMTYKYEALHNQLNPHFLFNSFNVLSSLVFEDQDLAVEFLDQLSDLYERVLNGKEKELITLEEELEFIESYVFLLKTRFEDKLDIKIDLKPEKGEFVAPMVLQLLIENAVKHNTVSKAHPLKVRIGRNGNHIETTNSLRLKRAGDHSSGMGLENIKQRYSFFTNDPIEIIRSDKEFNVKVPILSKAV